jgi:WXG100 family type VII secretion target
MATDKTAFSASLTQDADQIRNMRDNVSNEFSRLNKIVHSLPAKWEGEAANAYVNMYDSYNNTFNSFLQFLEALETDIKSYVRDMSDVDAAHARNFQKMM